jgi:hypothetical protein
MQSLKKLKTQRNWRISLSFKHIIVFYIPLNSFVIEFHVNNVYEDFYIFKIKYRPLENENRKKLLIFCSFPTLYRLLNSEKRSRNFGLRTSNTLLPYKAVHISPTNCTIHVQTIFMNDRILKITFLEPFVNFSFMCKWNSQRTTRILCSYGECLWREMICMIYCCKDT